jgi:hypothetical protein
MTQQWNSTNAARPAVPAIWTTAPSGETQAHLRAAGRRGAPHALVGEALAHYWRFVANTTLSEREAVVRALRADIATGHTTARACVAVALGEPDFALVRAATRAYVGGWPASVERRAQVLDEVIDWIVRGLALDRAALCCALLDCADATCVEKLALVRNRLDTAEADRVFAAFRDDVHADVATFLEEWRALRR